MPAVNEAKEATLDRAACPVLETDKEALARRGVRDALALVHDVRHIDPSEVWGRLARWRVHDPERLFMALVTMAVFVPDEATMPGWVKALTGGLTALQPETRIPRPRGTLRRAAA